MQIRTILLLGNAICLFGCGDQKTPLEKQVVEPISQKSAVNPGPEKVYDLALAMAEAGDSKLLPLCDSLLQFDSARAGAFPYYYLGIYYAVKKVPEKAIHYFDRTLVEDYRFLEAYIEKAALYYELKKPEQALRELELLRTISPSYAPAHYWIAKVAESLAQYERALQHYRLAVQLDSSFKEAKEGIRRLEK